jgi:hypothetical protein
VIKKILLLLLIALVVIQFFHPKRNKAEGDQPEYIGKVYPVPEDVRSILAKACNDCHTNNTRYPWYSNVQPVDWWLTGHINDGKKELNLDDYSQKSLRFQYKKMEEIIEQVKEGKMPLKSYLWIHKDAILANDEKNKLIDWADAIRDSMKAKYPMDSLVRKK